ncbi:hypothetical protein LPW26_10625 [Rhodopseudomonas sp. HC1]|uniref:hypothetical protein n=1 Tax=Rhodopseudomonas infernalis TaxID=2897386 RepID=UPI001EE872DA|nr:hypothetical protein [Rhodopseudomonas infernalis]MCG6205093.1 hypothetical protein [Rhodopseudomonas infernalis]
MQQKITGEFSTRRAAELAVERLVQEHGVDRKQVAVQARGRDNSAGTKAAGADTQSGHPGEEKHGDPELNDVIEVSVAGGDSSVIKAAMMDAGARSVN